MSQKSAELKAQGVDIINLSVGEPDFNTPDHIKVAAKQAIDDNWSRYSPVPGYLDLREAICAKLLRENHLESYARTDRRGQRCQAGRLQRPPLHCRRGER